VLVANALRSHAGDLEDASSISARSAWTTARRVTFRWPMPALLAGALVAFLQAMTLFGSPAILALPAGFHTMTTKIWSLFQYPPKLELAAAASLAAAAAHRRAVRAQAVIPLAAAAISIVGGPAGRSASRALGKWNGWRSRRLPRAAQSGVPALRGAPQRGVFAVPSEFVSFENLTLHNIAFVFFELSSTGVAFRNTLIPVHGAATSHRDGGGDCLHHIPQGHRLAQGFGLSRTAPVAVPGIDARRRLFLTYTRPPFVLIGHLCGSCSCLRYQRVPAPISSCNRPFALSIRT